MKWLIAILFILAGCGLSKAEKKRFYKNAEAFCACRGGVYFTILEDWGYSTIYCNNGENWYLEADAEIHVQTLCEKD